MLATSITKPFHGILVHVFSMAHVYNEVANQDLQRRKSLNCKPVDIPVFFWKSVDSIIMVLTKLQNILITSSYLIALLELLTVLLEYIDLFSVKRFHT